MSARRGPATHGFALFELAVGAVVLGVLAGVLLSRLVSYAGESEVVAAKQLISSLRTALAVRSAKALASAGQDGLLAVAHQNPMDWLAKQPENYLGEYYSPREAELPKGNWYFDKANRTLVYLPGSPKSFSSETPKFLRFKVKLLRVPKPVEANGRNGVTEGLVLEEVEDQTVANSKEAN